MTHPGPRIKVLRLVRAAAVLAPSMSVLSAATVDAAPAFSLALAQEFPAVDTTASPAVTEPCDLGRIAVIFVDNRSIYDTTDPALDQRFAPAYRVANALHVTTREAVIRRELPFREGDCYDPALLGEAARLLRTLEFLAQVDVYGVRQDDGSYHVVVDTQDEWSTQLNLNVGLRERRLTFSGARVREENVLGTGQSIELYYVNRDAAREHGITYSTPQFAATRMDLRLQLGRTRAGTVFDQLLAYPFVGEIGKWAARQAFGRRDDMFEYVVDDVENVRLMVPIRQKGGELAVVRRFGRPGRLGVIGGGVTFQELSYPGSPQVVYAADYDNGEAAAPLLADETGGQREEVRNVRAVLLMGDRKVRWIQRRGLDSMRGQQDVALGRELQIALGRSIPGVSTDDDVYAAVSFQAAAEVGPFLVSGRTWAEGRRDVGPRAEVGNARWEDLVADVELLTYWRMGATPVNTLVFRGAASGGWHTRTPYQLKLGGQGGVRGYEPERFPGGRRVVFTLENRTYFGWPASDLLDLGGTLFLDAGRVWPGDAPFGRDSGWRAAIGAGLRGAFPAGSRTTYRLDFAVPLENGLDWPRLRMSVSVGEVLGLRDGAWGAEPRLGRPRYSGSPARLFRIPD